ncbi:MAG TPA: hypothetical protein VFU02_07160, partial [Polyangiaceae bacterium]|nr:hypothetical protein [Polyangiaceae bacterium]
DRVAASCTFELPSDPIEHTGLGGAAPLASADERLARLCQERLQARFPGRPVPAVYRERLAHELETIAELGQAPYFLAVGEVVERALATRVPVIGRGSAVASLVVHVLGASPVDPVAQGLVFERFLHQRRHALPDVDLDVASTMRETLLGWVRRHFGRDRVAQVSALQKYQRRSAYRDGLKALGAGRHQIERFLAELPSDELLDAGHGAVPRLVLPESLRAKLPLIERLVGKPRHQSVHPGGVVIAERELAQVVPLERSIKGVLVTQYGADDIQAAGLLKLDLLGNHALDEVAETFQWLAQREDTFARSLVGGGVGAIPFDDPVTFQAIEAGKTLGCFQLETPAVRRVLSRVPVRSLDELTAALAIVRPGPASGRAKRAYIRRARGAEPASFWHAAFRGTLEATHGLLLYEEDIVLVLSTLAGLDLSTADELRELIQERGGDADWLARVRRGLVRRAVARGFSQGVADRVWRDVRRFAAYSFNKAHASSYALLAYRTAFLKTHAPVEFGCALLNHHAGSYTTRSIASELARQGVPVLPPSVQLSDASCSVEQAAQERSIRIGLSRHKHLRVGTLATLLRERSRAGAFDDVADFVERVRPNARELGALVWSGACDELAPLTRDAYPWLHAALLARLERLFAARPHVELSWRTLQAELAQLTVPEARGPQAQVALFQRLSRVHHELETLDMHVSDHPIQLLRAEASRQGCISTRELGSHVDQKVRLAVVIAATRKTPVRDGGLVQFVTFEDEHGLVEATLVGDALTRYGSWITTPGPFLVEGFVGATEGVLELTLTWLLPFHLRDRPYTD